MGKIIYLGLIRITIAIIVLWIGYDSFNDRYWWIFASIGIYIFVIHPIASQYKSFTINNNAVLNDSLCSRCKHFDETAVLCLKYDKHPTEDFVPCEGTDWEPK